MKLRRLNLANGPVMWDMKVPIEISLTDEQLRRLGTHPGEFADEIAEALGDIHEHIMGALEEACVRVDDEYESDITEIDLKEVDEELN